MSHQRLRLRGNTIPFAPKAMGVLGQMVGDKWEKERNKRKESGDEGNN